MAVFIVTLFLPIAFEIAGVRLSPNRLFLLAAIMPCMAQVLMGRCGRVTAVDLLFILHGMWMFVALIAVHGTGRIPFAGITSVELLGGYFLGRVVVRTREDYRKLFQIVMISLICLLPFALYESVTGKLVIPDLLRPFFETPERGRSAYGRMGLERVYVVFVHPILWGVFCAITLANFVMLARDNVGKIIFAILFSGFTTFLSLSSAPLIAIALQLGLLIWAWLVGGRWKQLIIALTVLYVVVDLLSDRTPVTILIETVTFNPFTGYTRIAIFDAGWAAVRRSPLFGIGFNDWPRPFWLTASVDNFWLLTAMRYGLVGVGFLVAAFGMHFWLAARADVTHPDAHAIRVGHLIALAGLSFTLFTVHIWDTLSMFVMFYVGAGAWLYTNPPQIQTEEPPDPSQAPPVPAGSRYTRFPTSPSAPRSAAPAAEPPPGGSNPYARSRNERMP